MKSVTRYVTIWVFISCFIPQSNCLAQCTLACNNQVNISLSPSGQTVVNPDMILEADDTSCPGPKTVEVYVPPGVNIGNTVNCTHAGMNLVVKVIHTASGNSCWGSIFIEDKLPPVITCADLTVGCTADVTPAALGFPAVTDNCTASPTLTFANQEMVQPCSSAFSAIVTRTWFAVDGSGNSATPCVQKIFLTRPTLASVVFPPNRDGVQAPALACPAANTGPSVTGFPTINGLPVIALCKINTDFTDLVFTNSCENTSTILRKWTVLECCTNQLINHTQIIKVVDNQPPVLTCPPSLVFPANGPGCAGSFILPAIEAADNCSSTLIYKTITPNGVINGNGGFVFNLPLGNHTVTYKVEDDCGNIGSCTVPLEIKDNVAPIAVCDKTTVVSLGSSGLATVAAKTFDDGSYDACCVEVTFLVKRMEEPNSAFAPNITFHCADAGDTVMVVLQVTDCKGNTNTCMVLAIVQDKTPPVITCPGPITISCAEDLPPPLSLTGEPQLFDNCGIDTSFFNDLNDLNMCKSGTITRTFTVTDEAGFSATCTQTITRVDDTPPSFIFPNDTLVNCEVPLNGPIGTQPVALGDCEIFGLNFQDEIFPKPCGLKIFRTYTYKEWCSGFDTSFTQLIIVEDHAPPVWNQPFGSLDKMFMCPGDLVKPPPPTASDFCTPVEVSLVSDVTMTGSCFNNFVRVLTFGAADTCGNVAPNFTITMTVVDTSPPFAPPLPDLGPFNCYADITPANINDVIGEKDNCLGPVVVMHVSDGPDPGCSGTVIRTYKLTDICGNDSLITQKILINDKQPPTADPLPVLGPFPCGDIPGFNTEDVTGEMDNCGGPVAVAFVSDSPNTGCSGIVIRTYSLTDQCGNDTLITQMILIEDNVAPVMDCPPVDEIEIFEQGICEAVVTIDVSAMDECGNNPLTFTNSLGTGGASVTAVFPVGVSVVVFTVEDACGNTASCAVLASVRDFAPPAITCSSFIQVFDNANPPPVAIDIPSLIAQNVLTAFDACADFTMNITPNPLDCSHYSCGNEPTSVPYSFTATDIYGNTSPACNQTIFLFDPDNLCACPPLIAGDNMLVAGLVFNENNTPMAGVEVQLQDASGMSTTVTTGTGLFHFDNVPPGQSCTLKPYKNTGILNGVSTYDLVLISRHILGTQVLSTPWKLIAADIDKSGAVSTWDLVLLRKVILQVSNTFPGNTSWRFVRKDYHFPDPAKPFVEPIPESVLLADISKHEINHNFIAVKIGDVNGSALANFDGGVDERSMDGDFPISIDGGLLKKGATVQIPVRAEAGENLSALQMTIQYDASKMALEGLTGAALDDINAGNYGLPQPGCLTFSWDNASGQLLEAGSTLFFLQFQILDNASVAEALTVNSSKTSAIAYSINGNPLNILMLIREASQVPVDEASAFVLSQNRPNPFSQGTRIDFLLKERMPVQLEIMDLSGRKWQVLNATFDAGLHEAPVSGDFFHSNGIYFYQLITPYGMERKKMIYAGGN